MTQDMKYQHTSEKSRNELRDLKKIIENKIKIPF